MKGYYQKGLLSGRPSSYLSGHRWPGLSDSGGGGLPGEPV